MLGLVTCLSSLLSWTRRGTVFSSRTREPRF